MLRKLLKEPGVVIAPGAYDCLSSRIVEKVGFKAQDTAELIFEDAEVPIANRLGEEGQGFKYLMSMLPKERLSIDGVRVRGTRTDIDRVARRFKAISSGAAAARCSTERIRWSGLRRR